MTNQEAIKILSLFREKYAAENGLNTESGATEKAIEAIADFSGKWRDLPTAVIIHAIDTVLSANAPSWNNTPDWSTAPDWANWRAQDATGAWAYYEKKPVRDVSIVWSTNSGRWAFDTHFAQSWETSLQQRPKKTTDK